MNTKEILTIVALTALGLCLLCILAKSAMKKGDKSKKACGKACGAFVFLAIILLAVSQLLGEGTEKFECEVGAQHNSTGCTGPGGECGQAGEPSCHDYSPGNTKTCAPGTCCDPNNPDSNGKFIQHIVDNSGGWGNVAENSDGSLGCYDTSTALYQMNPLPPKLAASGNASKCSANLQKFWTQTCA